MNIKSRFSISDQIFFAQKLSLLLNSNISLAESLNIIKSIDNSNNHKNFYEKLINDGEHGISLSKSIVDSKVKFDSLLIVLIKNGEYSGSLVDSLNQVANNLDKRNELNKKLISTLIYPLFILFATIGMALFLILYIFPKILPLLSSLNIKLPLITIIIKFIYEFSISYGLYTCLILVLSFICIVFLIKKNKYIKNRFHYILLKIPMLGLYIKINTLATISGTGEIILSSGRSLSEFHAFSRDSVNNLIFKNTFESIYYQSIQGISFTNSMKLYPDIFVKMMVDMCAIGEKTGNLALMLGHCSKIFEQDIDLFLKRFSSLIEPVLMIFMGLIVGSIALSIILPVYEITNHLSK